MEIVLEGLQYPEGAYYSSRDDCLYFVEWLGDRILGYRDGRTWIVHQAPDGSGPCGLSQDRAGALWACFYSSARLVQLDLQGELQRVFRDALGIRFKGPNDLVHTPEGGLFFTDSGNFQDDWVSGRPAGSIYYLGVEGDMNSAADDIAYPNGIALSPDGLLLYVAEHRRNRILVFDIVNQGILANRRVFAELDFDCQLDSDRAYELGPDGICLDDQGRLWVAHYGGGKLIGLNQQGEIHLLAPLLKGRCPTNLAWHPREKALYITEAESGLLLRFQL